MSKKKIQYYQVLLVDDEYYVRQSLLRRIRNLENEDFKVIGEAENGEEALDMLRKHDIQLVITDIRMPVMDGLDLTRKILEQYPHILTVILTGYADFEYARKALRYGAFDYLLKPVSEESLDNLLSRARTRLSEHYMEDIDISLMASELGFHSAYLTRLFGRYAGVTPLKYLTNLRIQEAKRLLLDTSLPISVVGERVGYPDQFHFSKTFRKATGVNPSAFRKQEKESL